jgi:hypothetical protein
MDLKAYYRKIREVEATIEEEFPLVKSVATEEGGPEGRLTEVPRAVAARMITDGSAVLADADEAKKFRAHVETARKAEEERRQAEKIQFTILSESNFRSLQRSTRGGRKE